MLRALSSCGHFECNSIILITPHIFFAQFVIVLVTLKLKIMLHSVSSQVRYKFVDVSVNGHLIHFKIDTGAEVTVVPSSLVYTHNTAAP